MCYHHSESRLVYNENSGSDTGVAMMTVMMTSMMTLIKSVMVVMTAMEQVEKKLSHANVTKRRLE